MGEEVWIEKYRPSRLSEIIGQDAIVRNLQSYVKSGNMPHLIFAGPAGVGKTAAAVALAKEFFGDRWRDNFIELNASVAPETPLLVREGGKIKRTNFAELASRYGSGKYARVHFDVLSIDRNYEIKFLQASHIFRHKVSKIAEIRYEGGRLRASLSHSVIVLDEYGNLIPKKVSELSAGDLLISFQSYNFSSQSQSSRGFLPVKTVVHLLECIIGRRSVLHHFGDVGVIRTKKEAVMRILSDIGDISVSSGIQHEKFVKLVRLLRSMLSVVFIERIDVRDYDDFVYDISVPGSEMFWGGGDIPVLLHNSDERGIDTVRTSIKNFARSVPLNAPFKIIFLDEADALTHDAQSALRRTMEQYSEICRFIFSVNLSAKLIEPIQSRCAIFRFRPLSDDAIARRIRYIAEQEGLELTDEALNAIVFVANGDMRRAINTLQSAAALGMRITAEMIYEITATARPEQIEFLLRKALSGDFTTALRKLDELRDEGIFADEILAQMHRSIMRMKIPAEKKVEILNRIGETDFRIAEGANENIQLDALIAFICLISEES
ncbi:MAG: replication factor C small subunit [Canidatus Methanoxibalbensis ujae]|nr:replication factor C small subunit [Candidatus Methanoxibalbensis ujae]